MALPLAPHSDQSDRIGPPAISFLPVIEQSRDGDITPVRLLDRALAPVACPLLQAEPFYAAVRALLASCYSGADMIEFKLAAGEMLVFNNQRLLHGRTGIDPASGRHVDNWQADPDEFYSRRRFLYRERHDPKRWTT